MDSIFDSGFNGSPRSEMYRHQILPELFPHEKPMLVDNWHPEDQIAYAGGKYAKAAYLREPVAA